MNSKHQRNERLEFNSPATTSAASSSELGSGTATRFETKMPEVPSVKLAEKASWPKLLNPLGRPSLLPVQFSTERL